MSDNRVGDERWLGMTDGEPTWIPSLSILTGSKG